MRNMSDVIAKSLTPLSTIQICNTKSIRYSKLEKTAKNLIFGYLDHSKSHFSDFWMIQDEWHLVKIMHTIKFYQNMQYRDSPMFHTQENSQKLYGSFKKAKTCIRVAQKKIFKVNQIFPGPAVFAETLQILCFKLLWSIGKIWMRDFE